MAQLQSTSITGSLIVTQGITAQSLNVQYITSSIVYSSGSNKFGDQTSDTQSVTGSLNISGSMFVDGTTIFDTSTGNTPVYITRLGNTNEALRIYVDDSAAYFQTFQDETATSYGSMYFILDNGAPTPEFGFQYGATTVFKVQNASNSYINHGGNFGIGTTSPTTRLEVNRNTANTLGTADGVLQISGDLSPIAFVGQSNLNPGLNRWGIKLREVSDGDFSIYSYTNSATRLLINSSGNVGIGVTNPARLLDINGTTNFRDAFYFSNGAVGYTTWGTIDGALALNIQAASGYGINLGTNASTGRVVVTSGGNVGIGTVSPTAKLYVSGSSDVLIAKGSGSTSNTTILAVDGNNGRLFEVSDDLSDSLFSVNTIAGLPVMEAFADYTVVMGSYNKSDLVITGSKVGIGTPNPQRKLDVYDSGSQIIAQFSSSNATSTRIKFSDANTGAENVNVGAIGTRFAIWTNNTERLSILSGGSVGIGSSSPGHALSVLGTVSASAFLGSVTTATSASFATSASYANNAGNAATANFATSAGSATTATSASFASTAPYSGLTGTVPTWNQSTTGNAASATVLQTARTIGGVSFNGSANINLPGVNTAGNQDTSGNAATATTASFATTAATAASATNATNATNINVSERNDNVNYQVLFSTANGTGNQSIFIDTDDAHLTYNPSSRTLTSATFVGNLTGNADTATSAGSATTATSASFATSASNARSAITASSADTFFVRGSIGVGISNPGSNLTVGTSFATIPGITVDTGNTGNSAFVARKTTSKPAFGLLPWDTAVFLSSGVYYDGDAWQHHSNDNNNQLFALDPAAGARWYASNSGTPSWNISNNQQLWDNNAHWTNIVRSTRAGDSHFTGGNVGINTTSPSNKLQVVGGVTATSFTGSLLGNASSATSANSATNADNIDITQINDNVNYQVTFTTANASSYSTLFIDTDDAHLTYNPSSRTLTSATFVGSLTGNADTVTNGVYTTGNQTIGGTKTFSSTIVGSINGNAATATTASYASTAPYSGLTGTVPTWNQNTTGNAATATSASFAPNFANTNLTLNNSRTHNLDGNILTFTATEDESIVFNHSSGGTFEITGNPTIQTTGVLQHQGSGYFTTNIGIGTTATTTARLHVSASTGAIIRATAAGSDILIVSSSGNVGIGTSNPSTVLHLKDSGTTAITFEDSSGGTQTAKITYDQSGQNNLKISTQYQSSTDENKIHFAPADSISMTIRGGTGSSNGFVGIGSTAPGHKLDVVGNVNFSGILKYGGVDVISNSSTDVYINGRVLYSNSTLNDGMYINYNSTSGTSAHLRLFANGANERMRIDASTGNVGIGTNNPTGGRVHIDGADPFLRVNNTSANNHGIKISYNYSDTHGLHLIYNANAATASIDNTYPVTSGQVFGDIYFRQNVSSAMTTRMMIKADGGNVGINTIVPTAKLHVVGDIKASLANTNQANFVGYNSSTGLLTYASTGSITVGTATNADNVYINDDSTDGSQPVLFASTVNEYLPVRGEANFHYNPSTRTLTVDTLQASEKSFVIPHQGLPGKKLVYGVLEGPEHSVYVRGKSSERVIELPQEWEWLVDEDSITVSLTPIGGPNAIYVEQIADNKIYVNSNADTLKYFYHVYATRKDVEPLKTVQ